MRLLVTRAAYDAGGLEARLAAMGHEAIIAALLDIEFLPIPPPGDASAVIVTSKNALRAIQRSGWPDQALNLPLYCPGSGTADLARSLGFVDVREASGDAASIPPLIGALRPAGSPIAYYCADVTAFDMEAALSAIGVTLRKFVAYRARPAQTLPADAALALRSGALDGVILMSPRTAQTYRRMLESAGLGDEAARIPAYCISANAAAPLEGLGCAIHVAAVPSVDGLLALLPK